jgi:hypothetical protein
MESRQHTPSTLRSTLARPPMDPGEGSLYGLKSQQYDAVLSRLSELDSLREQTQRSHSDELRHVNDLLLEARTALGENAHNLVVM